MKKQTGIYLIEIAHHRYVGSAARCLYQRMHQHASDLRLGKHGNGRMQNAYNKYQQFSFKVIEECEPDITIALEQYWINTVDPDLNISRVAASRLGTKQPQAYLDRVTGVPKSEATKQKVREARAKQVFSPEDLAKRAASVRAAFESPITCSNGKSYPSLTAASADLGITTGSISNVLVGRVDVGRTRHGLNFWYTLGYSRGAVRGRR